MCAYCLLLSTLLYSPQHLHLFFSTNIHSDEEWGAKPASSSSGKSGKSGGSGSGKSGKGSSVDGWAASDDGWT